MRLAELMGKPELASDQRFNSAHQRVANRDAIDQLVSDWTGVQEMDELVDRLNQAEVPCSPILSIADIFKDPQYLAREAPDRGRACECRENENASGNSAPLAQPGTSEMAGARVR